jgi:eukaryotic-like serine/threonine-protein kinase
MLMTLIEELLVLNVTAALKYLHERHVPLTHRDIKPGNVLISGEKARLADFGLAKSLEDAIKDEPEAKHNEFIYAAMPRFYRTPELVKRAKGDQTPLTTASDVYQLGTIFHDVITGFNPQERPIQVTDDIILTIKDIRGEYGARIRALVQRMLADAPSERPTAAQVMDDLLYIHRDYCFRVNELTGEFV